MDAQELRNLQEAYMEVVESDYNYQRALQSKKQGKKTMRKAIGGKIDAATKRIKDMKKSGEWYKEQEVVENQQLDEISQKTAISTYAQRRTGEFEGDDSSDRVAKTNKLKGRIEKKFGAKAGEHADRAADVKTFGRKDASGGRKQSPQPRIQTSDYENQREFKRELRIKRDRRLRAARGEDTNEQVDLYNIILSHLLDEGYAETIESAEAIMVNMSEEWRDSILG